MITDLTRLLENGSPDFGDTTLLEFSEYDLRPDIEHTVVNTNASVDLSLVVGTEHPDYKGCTWLELLGNPPGGPTAHLKRIRGRLSDLHREPEYYLNSSKKDHWGFYLLNGEYFVSEGMHRTVVARFFLACNDRPTIVHGVSVTQLFLRQKEAPEPPKNIWRRIFQKFSPTNKDR